ncbi:DnaA ATPase domain-containing protein [uncultured Acidaminococcus sp.]|uniref:DnaA ATPase domain-containing protein n=1 Tax=uncultured Acidaminococcus sp. TaxID=352152 RepID=UPI002586FA3D|nr:DnaA/Hda family protein [uncultured Acidaminococcus sp.]
MMTKNLAQIWAEMLAALSASFEGRSWKIWLDAAHPRTLEENTLSLDVPNDFTKNTLQEKYLPIMEESLSQICGKPMKVQIEVVETAKEGPSLFPDAPAQPAPEPAAVQPEPQPAAKPTQEFDSHLSPKYTFDNFIRGKSNEEAFNFSMGVANAPAKSYNPLFLYSDPGLGKTHLMNAIGNYIHKKFPQMKILYTSSETFTNELIGAIQHNTNEAFRNKYRNIDVLLIDDIQFLRKKESTQEEFFHTFEALKQADKQIIISSDRPPKELDTLEPAGSCRG